MFLIIQRPSCKISFTRNILHIKSITRNSIDIADNSKTQLSIISDGVFRTCRVSPICSAPPMTSSSVASNPNSIHSKIHIDYPQNPWGFITVSIPIPYPYPWESPWESPYHPDLPRSVESWQGVPLWIILPCLKILFLSELFSKNTKIENLALKSFILRKSRSKIWNPEQPEIISSVWNLQLSVGELQHSSWPCNQGCSDGGYIGIYTPQISLP